LSKLLKQNLTRFELENIEKCKKAGNIPKHVAIIMDGNGRWAKKRMLPRVAGHRKGIETVRTIVQTASNLGIKFLTLYTFSTENWKRPENEVTTLMRLIVQSLKNETDELNSNNVRLTCIGDIDNLPEVVQKELAEAEEKTKNNTKLVLNLALSYSGRRELIHAVKAIVDDVKNDIISEEISEELISRYLYTKDMPDPDLVIRSGGEYRISNFLLWQIAYSEIYVTDLLWPNFGSSDFVDAIINYQSKERRFGLVSEQLLNNNRKNTKNAKELTNQTA